MDAPKINAETLILIGGLSAVVIWFLLCLNNLLNRVFLNDSCFAGRWLSRYYNYSTRMKYRIKRFGPSEPCCIQHGLPISYCPMCELECRVRLKLEAEAATKKLAVAEGSSGPADSELPLAEEV